MLSKEKFVEILNRLKNYNDLQDKIDDLFEDSIDNREQNFCNAGSICIGHETIVVQLLENMFDTDMISYWLYELDYGKKYHDGCITHTVNGKVENIDISTAERLYDYLISEEEIKKISILEVGVDLSYDDYISKDKIRDKIEEYNKMYDETKDIKVKQSIWWRIKGLKELLESEK